MGLGVGRGGLPAPSSFSSRLPPDEAIPFLRPLLCGLLPEDDPDGNGLRLALRDDRLGLLELEAWAVARKVASPTAIRSTGAAPCRRAAVFITSPAAIPSPSTARDPRTTRASPVFTAVRMWRSSHSCSAFSASTALLIASAARTARSGSSSWATGAPKSATTASPMNFSTVPPNARARAESCVVGGEHGAYVLRIEGLGSRGRADDVREEGGDDLPLLVDGLGYLERRAARKAELRDLGVLGGALRTDGHTLSLHQSVETWERRRRSRNAYARSTQSPRKGGVRYVLLDE